MSETHSKLSRDRDDLLANIQEKNKQELNVLREKLDKATKAMDEKVGVLIFDSVQITMAFTKH